MSALRQVTMDGGNPIIPWDWDWILIGEVPISFLLEAVIRVGFLYFLLIMSMRILGKKMASQFTRNEMAAMVSLASAVGVPMLSPDRGLIPALIISIVVVSLSRLVIYFSSRKQKFESATLGDLEILADSGVFNMKAMNSTGITRERAMAQLRSEQLYHFRSGEQTILRSKRKIYFA